VRPGMEVFKLFAKTGKEGPNTWSFSHAAARVLALARRSENK
jgi:hypothetical protein